MKKTTIREFLAECEDDTDVGNDYADTFLTLGGCEREAYICYCPGAHLSANGLDYFRSTLDLEIEWGGGYATVHIPKGEESEMDALLSKVFMMFYTFAGYVSCSFYDKMIEEEEI